MYTFEQLVSKWNSGLKYAIKFVWSGRNRRAASLSWVGGWFSSGWGREGGGGWVSRAFHSTGGQGLLGFRPTLFLPPRLHLFLLSLLSSSTGAVGACHRRSFGNKLNKLKSLSDALAQNCHSPSDWPEYIMRCWHIWKMQCIKMPKCKTTFDAVNFLLKISDDFFG